MRIIIIYHRNCNDGFAAALAAWMVYGDSAEYIPAQYGEPPPDVLNANVFILDFSYPRAVLEKMYVDANNLVVLDHHKTAEQDLMGLQYAIFDNTKSGAVLAWEHFHPHSDMPLLFKVVQDRDLWKFEYCYTKAISLVLRDVIDRDFNTWYTLMDNVNLMSLQTTGDAMLKTFAAEVKVLSDFGAPVTLMGKQGLSVNCNVKYNSDVGHELAKQSGTYGVTYIYAGINKRWLYSLRSVGDYDVSVIAKHYGGGGHKNAAAFTSETFYPQL